MLQTENPGLIIVDMQYAIDSYSNDTRNNLNAENIAANVLQHWRHCRWPVIHVRHSSKNSDSPYHVSSEKFAIKQQVAPQPQEKVITKSENCAFIGTDLGTYLVKNNIKELVVCGVLTNNSVDATVRVGAALGYKIYLLHDATAAFGMTLLDGTHRTGDEIHWIFLSNLHREYATVCQSSDVIINV